MCADHLFLETTKYLTKPPQSEIDKISQLEADFLVYCSACHDVPKIMMVFPSYRKDCAEARKKLLVNATITAINNRM